MSLAMLKGFALMKNDSFEHSFTRLNSLENVLMRGNVLIGTIMTRSLLEENTNTGRNRRVRIYCGLLRRVNDSAMLYLVS